jgi:hypothetical protein
MRSSSFDIFLGKHGGLRTTEKNLGAGNPTLYVSLNIGKTETEKY